MLCENVLTIHQEGKLKLQLQNLLTKNAVLPVSSFYLVFILGGEKTAETWPLKNEA
jgi:hypothetical protein